MAGNQCKSCLSPNHDVIDERLRKGETCESLSEWLRGQDEMISPPSILRHRKNHLVGMILENKKTGRFIGLGDFKKEESIEQTNEPFIDTNAVLTRIAAETTDTDIFTSVFEARKFTQLLMERIVQNQLVIVHELQQLYSAGKAGYPDSQIRGLKTILDITNALPTYADKSLLRKMKDNDVNGYTDKIKQNARMVADDLNTRFPEEWGFLLSPEETPYAPHELIEGYSETLYTSVGSMRQSWRDSMVQYWNECFNHRLSYIVDYDNDIKKIIDDHWYNDGDINYPEQYQQIVGVIMTNFKTSELAISENNRDLLENIIGDLVATFERVEEVV
jgi:hypothetical protein